jgi:hypothetical protein
MPVISMMRFQGDTDQLAAAIREHLDPVAERLAEKHGGLANIVARTADGVLVVNLWETEEGRHAMAEEPEIQQAIRAAGLPAPNFEGFEVLELHVNERAVTLAGAR